MSFTYTIPTSLAGTPASLSISLTWNPSVLIGAPSLLLHMDGVNGSTAFPDSSGSGNVMTPTGVSVNTASPKFGSGAADFGAGGGGHNMTCPASNGGPLDLSTGDWTIEGWVKWSSAPGGNAALLSSLGSGTSGWQLLYNISSGQFQGSLNFVGGATASVPSVVTPITTGTWYALAIVRNGDVFDIWVNGVSQGTPVTQAGNLGNVAGVFTVGSIPSVAGTLPGQIDEVRVTKGTALYSPGVNYTPTTIPFPGVSPVGYDVYRNGVSIAQYTGVPGFIDTVPVIGVYTYRVAASDGVSTDLSDLSAPFTVAIGQISGIQGAFVPALDYKAIMVANPGSINPRIYPPQEDVTVRVKT